MDVLIPLDMSWIKLVLPLNVFKSLMGVVNNELSYNGVVTQTLTGSSNGIVKKATFLDII